MVALSIRAVGSSAGVVLPRSVLTRLRCGKGDKLYVVETPNGIELTPYDPEFSRNMDALDELVRRNRNLMKKLAE